MAQSTVADGGEAADGEEELFEACGRELASRLTELEAGDRVLWGDRKQPATVARVVTPDDRVGQTLSAKVIPNSIIAHQKKQARREGKDPDDYFLEPGDVFCDPTTWGGLTGKTFVVIQGPRGGFYAITKARNKGRTRPAMFRAVRSFHKTRYGYTNQGAFKFDGWFDDTLRVVEHGEPPEVLDPAGDLAAYDDVADNRLVSYDRDAGEHYVVGTVKEAFDRGLKSAHEEAHAEFLKGHDDDGDDPDGSPIPDPETVARTPKTASPVGTVTVTDIYEDSEYGLKAVIETPPPWETPDRATPANEVIKSLPWDRTHYAFDGDREAWTIDLDELTKVAGVFADNDYVVRAEYDTGDA